VLSQRPDDNEDVIENRLKVYTAQTKPLIEYYDKLKILRRIDAEGSVDEVFERIERVLAATAAHARKS
jgi:adenylate kinase